MGTVAMRKYARGAFPRLKALIPSLLYLVIFIAGPAVWQPQGQRWPHGHWRVDRPTGRRTKRLTPSSTLMFLQNGILDVCPA
jgi:hypothetical protein